MRSGLGEGLGSPEDPEGLEELLLLFLRFIGGWVLWLRFSGHQSYGGSELF